MVVYVGLLPFIGGFLRFLFSGRVVYVDVGFVGFACGNGSFPRLWGNPQKPQLH